MEDRKDKQIVQRVFETSLSGLREDSYLAQRVLNIAHGKEEKNMKVSYVKGGFVVKNKKLSVSFVLMMAAVLLSVTALAATGVLKGFFQDVANRQGAVVGTSYEQATDEISMSVTVNGDELTALVTFVTPQMMPYSEAEKLGIATYQIVDANGMVVKEGATESAEIITGQATVYIQMDDIDSGSYKFVVTSFVTEKKADQPLNLNGNWECAFTKFALQFGIEA